MDKTYERINSLFEHGLIDSGISNNCFSNYYE